MNSKKVLALSLSGLLAIAPLGNLTGKTASPAFGSVAYAAASKNKEEDLKRLRESLEDLKVNNKALELIKQVAPDIYKNHKKGFDEIAKSLNDQIAKTEQTIKLLTETKTDTETKPGEKEGNTKEESKEEDKGEGTVYLENESGTTENGNIPFILGDDYQIYQMGITSENMDGSKITFIYVDDKLITKEQLADSQGSIDLEKEQLTVGIHDVVIKQYEEDDESKPSTFVRNMQYEVKAK